MWVGDVTNCFIVYDWDYNSKAYQKLDLIFTLTILQFVTQAIIVETINPNTL